MQVFRQMSVTDIPAAFHVRTSTVENALTVLELEEEYALTPGTLAEAMQGSAGGWVCEVDGQVVGFAMGDSDSGELTVIAVLPAFERCGIGKRLLAEVEAWLFESGHDELWLVTTRDTTLRAYGFYVSRGWISTGEIVEGDEKFVLRRPDSQ